MSKTQSQEYRGNGEHKWEDVGSPSITDTKLAHTQRLRVPGGWLYRDTIFTEHSDGTTNFAVNVVFVPMPEVVKHAV
jgi:hypothetical protein